MFRYVNVKVRSKPRLVICPKCSLQARFCCPPRWYNRVNCLLSSQDRLTSAKVACSIPPLVATANMHLPILAVVLGLLAPLLPEMVSGRLAQIEPVNSSYSGPCDVQHAENCQASGKTILEGDCAGICCVCKQAVSHRLKQCSECQGDNSLMENGKQYCRAHWGSRHSKS